MKSVKCRPNVYKRDANVPTWKEESRAWLFVVVVIVLLRGIYYLLTGV